MVRRVPVCLSAAICLRKSLGRRKAILLQPRILPYARRQCLLFRQTPPLPDGARDENISPRQPASHHPISRLEEVLLLLVCYDLRFPVWSRNTSNEYDLLIYVANSPFPPESLERTCSSKRARWKTSVMSAVSTVSARTAETFHTAEAVSCLCGGRGGSLSTVPDNEEAIATASLNLSSPAGDSRLKFPAWKIEDEFVISQIIVHSSHYTYAFI